MEEEKIVHDVSAFSSRVPSSTHPSSHHPHTPHKGNKPAAWLRHRPIQTYHLLLLIFLTSCISLSSASKIYLIEELMVEPDSEDLVSAFSRLAHSGTILVDERPPPNAAAWILATENDDLQRRDLNTTDVSSASSTTLNTTTSTLAPTSASTGLPAATTQSSSPLPSPFDSGFSSNVTDSCAAFVKAFLSNSTFKSCLPFSLLLQVCLHQTQILMAAPSHRVATRANLIPNRTLIPSSKLLNPSSASPKLSTRPVLPTYQHAQPS